MGWQRTGANKDKGSKFIRYEKGKVIEGVITKIESRPSPFTEGQILFDYHLTTDEGEQVLSSGAATLKDAFADIPLGTRVQIKCTTSKKGFKCYNVLKEVVE